MQRFHRSTLRRFNVISVALLLATDLVAQTQTLPLASRFTGTWKREDSDDTITLSVNHDAVNGDAVVITNSNGLVGAGILKDEKIIYTGAVEAEGGKVKVAGAYMVSPDGMSLIKLRKVLYNDGPKDETVTYFRVSPPPSMSTPTPSVPALLARTDTENAAASPGASATPARSSPFIGLWKPADDSAKLNITVNGRNVALKYSPGPHQAGAIRENKVECEPISSGDGTKDTDVFEMSPNGRTLIRRRTVESPRGETAHETLTYSRAD